MKNIINSILYKIDNFININKYNLEVGSYAIQGRRDHMEDTKRIVKINLSKITNCYLIILCDGHSGGKCSKYVVSILPKILERVLQDVKPNENLKYVNKLITKVILKIDYVYEKYNDLSGTTCVFSIFLDDKLYIVNIGDSRCIISNLTNNINLETIDHKPDLPKEYHRIIKNNGNIYNFDVPRVYITELVHGLAISRVIGDIHYKKKNIVIANPDIYVRPNLLNNEFMVLASDGLWDVMSNLEVTKFVSSKIKKMSLKMISKKLVEHAFQKGSMDNITVIIVIISQKTI